MNSANHVQADSGGLGTFKLIFSCCNNRQISPVSLDSGITRYSTSPSYRLTYAKRRTKEALHHLKPALPLATPTSPTSAGHSSQKTFPAVTSPVGLRPKSKMYPTVLDPGDLFCQSKHILCCRAPVRDVTAEKTRKKNTRRCDITD